MFRSIITTVLLMLAGVTAQAQDTTCRALDLGAPELVTFTDLDTYDGGLIIGGANAIYHYPDDTGELEQIATGDETRFIAAAGDAERILATDGAGVHVYERTDGTWTETALLNEPDAPDDQMVGFDLEIVGDTAVVGAPFDFLQSQGDGEVFVYQYDAGEWTRTATLSDSDDEPDNFGVHIDIATSDGGIDNLLVGYFRMPFRDAAIYEQTDGEWTQTTQLTGQPAAAIDGDTAAILDAPFQEPEPDPISALMLQRGSDGEWQGAPTFTLPDEMNIPMELKLHDNLAVVRGLVEDSQAGNRPAVVVFQRSLDDTWQQLAMIQPGDGATFGRQLVVRDDVIFIAGEGRGEAAPLYRVDVSALADDQSITCE